MESINQPTVKEKVFTPYQVIIIAIIALIQFTVILDSSQLGLQIHESIGHPIELDRVLGTEANYAGMSFLTRDKLRTLRYGSDIVNVVCDATEEHGPGLGTFAFDDEGVPAQSTPIITNGLFTGYMTSRETAADVGDAY